ADRMTLSPVSFVTDGTPKTPDIIVRNAAGIILTENSDYTITFSSNIDPGTAEAVVTGIGNYTDEVTLPFFIQKKKASLAFSSSAVSKTLGDAPFTFALKTKETDGVISWFSSDTSVAEVDNYGKVTLKGAGSTVITAEAAAGKTYYAGSASYTLNVAKKTPSLAFSAGTVNKVYGNAAFTLTPSVKMTDGSLSWSSSNTAVAVVDNYGKVTIKGAGSARITVKASAGKTYAAGSASYVLNVGKGTNVITASNITKTTASAAQKIAVNAAVKVSTTLTYKSDNDSIRVSSKGIVTIPKNYVGSATITITGKATSNYNAVTKKITVTSRPKPTTLISLTNKKGKILQVTWNRNSKATGYQIQYSTKKDFSSYNLVTVRKNTVTASQITNQIRKGKTYYVRIRTYKTVGGKKYYSAWSKALSRKIVK
ncbi:MAG: hypothetical protein HUJ73_08975, partial [Eubacterium sp.]|nr:hypothetical protein [Eubacterium sp.]